MVYITYKYGIVQSWSPALALVPLGPLIYLTALQVRTTRWEPLPHERSRQLTCVDYCVAGFTKT